MLSKIKNKKKKSDEFTLEVLKDFIHYLKKYVSCGTYYNKYAPDPLLNTINANRQMPCVAIMGGTHTANEQAEKGSHAWVIDGYKIRNYTSPEGRIDKTQNIVHCNWGWLGNSNGYFVSGIFKTNEGVSYDYSGTPQNEKYWYLFNTITYDKPVKTD